MHIVSVNGILKSFGIELFTSKIGANINNVLIQSKLL
jgi:hypothetical protein